MSADLLRFRRTFVAIWLLHDVADLWVDGSRGLVLGPPADAADALRVALLVALVISQAAIFCGRWPAAMCLLALVLRGLQVVTFMPLNDFLYVGVMLVFCARLEAPPPLASLDWRRSIGLQTAWIYAATGILKCSPVWLSGGHLAVRQQHLLQHLGWPYPTAYLPCIRSLLCNCLLAWAAVAAELALALLVLRLCSRRAAPPWCRHLTVLLAVGVHGFGALFTNVWFFGASMLAQVSLVASGRRPAGPSP